VPDFDATAAAALAEPVVLPAWFIYLDVLGDPIRVTTHGVDTTFSGTGDAELDGTYTALDHRVIQVGDVTHTDSGSDTLTIDLSGILSMDADFLNDIGDHSKWRGRVCRLWLRLLNESGSPIGAIVPYYTGYMSAVGIYPSPQTQMVRLNVENYLAVFNEASNRSYMNQRDYDAADTSASATIAASNSAKTGGRRSGGGFGWFGVIDAILERRRLEESLK
jgi:hypothetical protein